MPNALTLKNGVPDSANARVVPSQQVQGSLSWVLAGAMLSLLLVGVYAVIAVRARRRVDQVLGQLILKSGKNGDSSVAAGVTPTASLDALRVSLKSDTEISASTQDHVLAKFERALGRWDEFRRQAHDGFISGSKAEALTACNTVVALEDVGALPDLRRAAKRWGDDPIAREQFEDAIGRLEGIARQPHDVVESVR